MQRRRQILAALGLGLAFATVGIGLAQTGEPWKVAIISLIGDEMHVVRYRGQTGTQLAPTQIETIANPDPLFDNLAMSTATKVLLARQPTARISEVSPPKPGSDADPQRLLSGGKPAPNNPVLGMLRGNGFTHLLVIAKHRGAAQLQFLRDSTGSGQLGGLGFYIDTTVNTRNSSGEVAQGFIAPYAYFRASWIDLGRLQLLADEVVTASYTMSAAPSTEGGDPWGALSPAQKVGALKSLVSEGVASALPKMLDRR